MAQPRDGEGRVNWPRATQKQSELKSRVKGDENGYSEGSRGGRESKLAVGKIKSKAIQVSIQVKSKFKKKAISNVGSVRET